MKTPESEQVRVTGQSAKLPIKWLVALLAGAIAVGGWIMKQQMEHADLQKRVQDLEERQDYFWGKR